MKIVLMIVIVWSLASASLVFAIEPNQTAEAINGVMVFLSSVAFLLPPPVQGALFLGTCVVTAVTHGVKHIPTETRKKIFGKTEPYLMAVAGNTKHCANAGSVPDQIEKSIQKQSQAINASLDKQSQQVAEVLTELSEKLHANSK